MEYWKKRYSGNSSISEWTSNNLKNYYFSLLTGKYQFFDDLKLPFAWYRYQSSSTYDNGNYAYYRSSTPTSSLAYTFYSKKNENYIYAYYRYNYYEWHSIRCFKNEYNPVIRTVKFDTKWWDLLPDIKVIDWKTLRLSKNPINTGYKFERWYKDEDWTQPYDMMAPVNEDITLYAKWVCAEGYIKNWNECLPVDTTQWTEWYNFNALNVTWSDGQVLFTIMDRNLWATQAWTWTDSSYGYYYQWWNNYWFANAWAIKTSIWSVNASLYGPLNYYLSTGFI